MKAGRACVARPGSLVVRARDQSSAGSRRVLDGSAEIDLLSISHSCIVLRVALHAGQHESWRNFLDEAYWNTEIDSDKEPMV